MEIPELGVGLVYWPQLEPLLDSVRVIEVEPQSYWNRTGNPESPYRVDDAALEMLCSIPVPKIIHGVGFPVGGSEPPDPSHIPPLLEVAKALEVPWASEHLSFNKVKGPSGTFNTGFLLPPLQTSRGVDAAVSNIAMMKSRLGMPFAFETAVNYLKPREGEMTDGVFAAKIAERADCGILLDLHNIWANEINGRQPVEEFLSEIPLDRVWEVHLAGGFERAGFWLDAHSGGIPFPVIEIAKSVIPRLPNLGALIFEILPFFVPSAGIDLVKKQIDVMQGLWDLREQRLPDAAHKPPERACFESSVSPGEWEYALGSLAMGEEPGDELGKELVRDEAVTLFKSLAGEFRAGMVVDALKPTSRLLLLGLGEAGFREILARFWRSAPPELFESSEAMAFGAYLKSENLGIPHLEEVVDFELAVIRSLITRKNQVAKFSHDPVPILEALGMGRFPESPQPGLYELEVTA